MSKTLRSTSALGAVLFALVGISACGGIPGDAVVQVNGTSISKTAFDHWMGVAAASSATGTTEKPAVPEPPNYTTCIAHLAKTAPKPAKGQPALTTKQFKSECETQYKSLQSEVLGFLISSQWVLGEASSLGVKLSDAEVKKEFTKIKSTQFPKASEFEKFLATSGQSVSDLLLRVKLNLLSQKIQKTIVKKKSTVTEAQISKYYNENKSKYGTPEKRSVRIILTKTEAAAASAKKEVESGKSFASVASKVSIDPTSKASGGLLKEVVKGEEEKALDTAIFSAKAKVLGGPVKTPFGYYVYEVLSATPGSQQSLSQVKSTIKQQLVATGEQSALSKFVKEFKTKWMGKTECRSGYAVADCKGYKAPKTSGTAKSVE
ncbi:MAG: peptidyl-prolyl cis-trans isomerase [Solirubrobacteraceae bacterium]